MSDGGVYALSGFLYQLIGSAATLAAGAAKGVSILRLESDGEDALLTGPSGKELIQFKYSTKDRGIEPAELARIMKNLESHPLSAECDWKLFTNRIMSDAVNRVLDAPTLDQEIIGKSNADNCSLIHRLRTRLQIELFTLSDFQEQILHRGREFGLFEQEISRGAHRIVGAMMYSIAKFGSGARIDQDFLDNELVGIESPRPLKVVAAPNTLSSTLEDMASFLDGPTLDEAIPRHALIDLFSNLDESVVVVTGPGGCGKTLSVIRAVRDFMQSSGCHACVLLSERHDSPARAVAEWRNANPNFGSESLDLSIERIGIANASFDGCAAVFATDGLDEFGWRNRFADARDLIRLVKNSVCRMKVIITCRTMQDAEALLVGTGTGSITSLSVREIPLGVYRGDEFSEVWRRWFPSIPIPPSGHSKGSDHFEPLSNAARPGTAIDERVSHTLLHPATLGCLRRLKSTSQRAFLDGDEGAWGELVELYITWFAVKANRRQGIQPWQSRQALATCARATSQLHHAKHDFLKDWIRPLQEETELSSEVARNLFFDAITSGVIVTDERLYKRPVRLPICWRWNNPFVAQYLSTLA